MLTYEVDGSRISIWLDGARLCRTRPFARGSHSIYCQLNRRRGIKIVFNGDSRDQQFLEQAVEGAFSKVVPRVHKWLRCRVEGSDGARSENCDVFILEHVEFSTESWALTRETARLSVPFVQDLTEAPVLLTGDWFKPGNTVFRKKSFFSRSDQRAMTLIDFQDEMLYPRMATFGKLSDEDLARAKEIVRGHRVDKPDQDFYQGFMFDNLAIRGFRSPKHRTFDSYVKLRFAELFYIMSKKATVLDLGCAEGFFSFQAALAGASRVVAVDHTVRSLTAAQELNQSVFRCPSVEFNLMPLESYLSQCTEVFDVVYALSVFHQGYADFQEMRSNLEWLAEHGRTVVFETPLTHPRMRMEEDDVTRLLRQHFDEVYPMYRYPSYAEGSDRIIYRLRSKRFEG